MQKFCGACGAGQKSDAKFCGKCGQTFKASSIQSIDGQAGGANSGRLPKLIIVAATIVVLAMAGSAIWFWRGTTAASLGPELVEAASPAHSLPPQSNDISAVQSSFTAALTDTAARFVFPFDAAAVYEWCSGGLQYGAEVEVGRDYRLGFTLFTSMGASSCERGSLENLLAAGQTSVWKTGADGSSVVVPAKISTATSGAKDALVVTLEGRDVVNLLFGDRPANVTLVRTLPSGVLKKSVQVEYRGRPPKAAASKLQTAEFGPGIADYQTQAIKPMRMFYFEQDGSIKWFDETYPVGERVSVETLRFHNGQFICMINDAERLWTNCDDLAPPSGGWANTKVQQE